MIERNNKRILALLLALMLSMAMCLAGCGSSDESESPAPAESTEAVPDDVSLMDDPDYTKPADPKLESQAKKLNEDEESFYGTWVSTSADAENLYGNLEITIKKGGKFTANITGEDYEGTWKKIDGGIEYTNEFISGKIYYGPTCVMTFEEFDENGQETDDDIMVVLKKQ